MGNLKLSEESADEINREGLSEKKISWWNIRYIILKVRA